MLSLTILQSTRTTKTSSTATLQVTVAIVVPEQCELASLLISHNETAFKNAICWALTIPLGYETPLQKAQSSFLKKPLTFGKQSISGNSTSTCRKAYSPDSLPPPPVQRLGSQLAGAEAGEGEAAGGTLDFSAPFGLTSTESRYWAEWHSLHT